ncbi:hypothetical protein [Planococcus maitriensis]|uniref:Uncharacterized protein n=1 Tax=Planococcus maitriensis TaxID=221799 RepID=A0A365K393_9BACL|nr:hypothetical protein [Planococcus maitriensis]RAZ67096.1 hypothetical protein DP119_12425 [Planococcus maitriensis]
MKWLIGCLGVIVLAVFGYFGYFAFTTEESSESSDPRKELISVSPNEEWRIELVEAEIDGKAHKAYYGKNEDQSRNRMSSINIDPEGKENTTMDIEWISDESADILLLEEGVEIRRMNLTLE